MSNFHWQGGSDSERESNEDAEVSKRSQKRLRGKQMNDNKALDGHFSDHSQSQSVASGDGCLSLLKKRNSGGLICKAHANFILPLFSSDLPLCLFCFFNR